MSENKILCMEMESPCVKCGSAGKLCSICATIKRYKSWPTREQAIEKMAKAICLADINGCTDCCKQCHYWTSYLLHAEEALNALLEVHDDEQ